jgi:signal transduction histidine kinase
MDVLTFTQNSPSFSKVNSEVHQAHLVFLDDCQSCSQDVCRMLVHDHRTVYQVNTIDEAHQILRTTRCSVLVVGRAYLDRLSADTIEQFHASSVMNDLSVVLLVDKTESQDRLLHYYDWGVVDIIPDCTESKIIQTKIALYETLFYQRNELREVNERLQNANNQLEEYVYIVSHDLKAPLRGLSSLAQFIEDEIGETITTEVQELLEMMKARTDRMQQMIDGILHYSRMSNVNSLKEAVDVKQLIINIIDLISLPSNVRIEFPDQLPVLDTEKIKFHEVLQNLILNAIKHNDKPDVQITIAYKEFPDHFEFSVADNGKGIKPEHREKVFGLFQTLLPKEKSEGTGLGLTIVKKIVEQQDGKVMLDSDFGKGSTFRFTWKK